MPRFITWWRASRATVPPSLWPTLVVLITGLLGARASVYTVIVWLSAVAAWLGTALGVIALEPAPYARKGGQVLGLVVALLVGVLLSWQAGLLPR